mgnify:CR=1 FL=1
MPALQARRPAAERSWSDLFSGPASALEQVSQHGPRKTAEEVFMLRKLIAVLVVVAFVLPVPASGLAADDVRIRQLEEKLLEMQKELEALKADQVKEKEEAKREQEEASRKTNVIAETVDQLRTQLTIPEDLELEGEYGMGPAASKVYRQQHGLSIGGYGEASFTSYVNDRNPGDSNVGDFERLVLYTGYKFNDWIVLNAEVEFEHGGTASSESASSGEVELEFAYLDFFLNEHANVRTGLVLVPMGFLNEWHEPVFYYSVNRPEVERQIIPTTWRELGVGVFGEVTPGLDYRMFLLNSMNAKGIRPEGVRDARQSGNRALFEDVAFVVRADYTPTPTLLFASSVFTGDTGQDQVVDDIAIPTTSTTIWEVHAQYRAYGLQARALFTMANLGSARSLTLALRQLGEISEDATIAGRMIGSYLELAYDVMPWLLPDSQMALAPFARYSYLNTQDETPPGLGSNSNLDQQIWEVGLDYRPIQNVVFKMDYRTFNVVSGSQPDEFNLGFGFVF